MRVKQITQPASEPIDAEDIKAQCRVETDEELELLESYVIAAREYCEDITNNKFISQQWEIVYSEFPKEIELPLRPLISIDSIYYEAIGGSTELATYNLDSHSFRAKITPATNTSWPDTIEGPNAVIVTATFGYALLPEKYRQAIRLIAADWYEMREDTVLGVNASTVPHAAKMLLSSQDNEQF